MQEDPYIILGLREGASEEEVRAAYDRLRASYSADRLKEGESGMAAARKMSEIENAYRDCLEDIRLRSNAFGSPYGEIESLIKNMYYDEAQRKLDEVDNRDAEWHYYQSVIYYKRGWHLESKKQLEICVALAPDNEKYASSLEKMKQQLSGKNPYNAAAGQQASAGGQSYTGQTERRAGYSQDTSSSDANANACCNTCSTLICCDCCCECMGGDLIPCC